MSGREAVARTEEAMKLGGSFYVYIMDWLMPYMNGIETTRRVRRVVREEVPITILSAYDWVDIKEEARAAGVTDFISKPLFPSDLRQVLPQAIRKLDLERAKVPIIAMIAKRLRRGQKGGYGGGNGRPRGQPIDIPVLLDILRHYVADALGEKTETPAGE